MTRSVYSCFRRVIRLLVRLAFVAASRVSLVVILKQFNFRVVRSLGALV
jgi:hypothetical protein